MLWLYLMMHPNGNMVELGRKLMPVEPLPGPTDLVYYNREEMAANLAKAAETIDEEIQALEDATKVTKEVLDIEFDI